MGLVGQEIQEETKKKQLICPAVRGRGEASKTERGTAVRENQDGGVQKAKQEVQGGLIQLSPMHQQVKEDEV